MKTNPFAHGSILIGAETVEFRPQDLQGRYTIWVPCDFVEDPSLISNYTYLYSPERSPLSIAIRYTPVASAEDRSRMVQHHFSRGSASSSEPELLAANVQYRDTLARGKEMSVYSLRFAIEVADGVLFGCFNCAGEEYQDWKPAVLEMLSHVEPRA